MFISSELMFASLGYKFASSELMFASCEHNFSCGFANSERALKGGVTPVPRFCMLQIIPTFARNKQRNMEQSPEINELRKAVEGRFGKRPVTPADFSCLSNDIETATRCHISVSTLKRLWGYVKGYDNTRRSTCDILCRYAGATDWETFLRNLNGTGAQSDFYSSDTLRSDTLAPGDRVEVSWQPNRHCVFRCLGDCRFVVERSENAKIAVDDTFRCGEFRAGLPLYLDEVCHTGRRTSYVAGASDGVLFRLVP